MSVRAGFVWDTPQHFNRYIEDCGITCELVTPHMLAAPFYRGTFNCLIIPTGFGNPKYSRLLLALRASSSRIRKFVEWGGNLLVFGAATDNPSAYDWLPFQVTYHHDYCQQNVTCNSSGAAAMIIHDYDADHIECDGIYPVHNGEAVGHAGDSAVIIEKRVGKGCVVVTSIHEFPSRSFLISFCSSGIQTLF
jgi:glutamine amidotransferase-like uncharacterized protein